MLKHFIMLTSLSVLRRLTFLSFIQNINYQRVVLFLFINFLFLLVLRSLTFTFTLILCFRNLSLVFFLIINYMVNLCVTNINLVLYLHILNLYTQDITHLLYSVTHTDVAYIYLYLHTLNLYTYTHHNTHSFHLHFYLNYNPINGVKYNNKSQFKLILLTEIFFLIIIRSSYNNKNIIECVEKLVQFLSGKFHSNVATCISKYNQNG